MVRRQRPNVLVTGTPGTGKTTFSQLLANYTGLAHHNVGQAVSEHKLYAQWDSTYDLPVFDDDMVVDHFEPIQAGEGVILDFHSSGLFPLRWFDLVILLRANNTVLFDRLTPRGYSSEKIHENLQCEILEVTSEEVYESYPKEIVLELTNEQESQMEVNLQKVMEWLTRWKQERA